MILFLIFSIYLLNMSLTAFFANKITYQSTFSFLLIWILIGFLFCFIYIIIKLPENGFVIVKGLFFSFFALFIITMILTLLKFELNEFYIQVLFISFFLIVTLIFQRFYNLKWIAFISYFPFSFTLFFIILSIVDKYFLKIPILIFIVAVLILAFSTTFLYYERFYIKEKNHINHEKAKLKMDNYYEDKRQDISDIKNEAMDINNSKNGGLLYKTIIMFYKMFSGKTNTGIKFMLGLLLLAVFIWTPRLSMFCGQAIRTLNLPYGNQIEINYINQNGVEGNILGNFYIEHNSTLYISNSEWRLETIKPINYHIKPIK